MDESKIWDLIAKKMAAEASEEELAELDEIFKTNPGIEYAFSVLESMNKPSSLGSNPSAEESDLLDKKLSQIEEIVQQDRNKNVKTRIVKFRKSLWAAASLMIIVSASLMYYYLSSRQAHEKAPLMAKSSSSFVADSPTTITLQDGTKVWLNSGSTLKCAADFGKKYRTVVLSGEAYFEVTHNAAKPFIVKAGSFMNVKVLGTTFNVKAYPGDPYIKASLITGKIAIDLNNQDRDPILLKPREKITFHLNGPSAPKSVPEKEIKTPVAYQINRIKPNPLDKHISELSWMRGELAFNEITFAELAYDLERRYHISIEFKDEQLKDYHLTGVFKGENLNEVLQALQVTTPFNYKITDQKALIYY